MNEEIKEILNYITNYIGYNENWQKILWYISSLEEENKKLKERLEDKNE